jgi:8-oxo-dGTP diphosphatase
MEWRDSAGKRLADYPHPSVAVDVALLTVVPDGRRLRMAVLVHRREDSSWSLPGTFLRIDERLDEAALRALRDKVGVTGERPQQLRVFDDPERDPRYRVLGVAHVDLVRHERLADRIGDEVALVGIDGVSVELPDGQRHLCFDHDAVVAAAVGWARAAYAEHPDPAGLLGGTFTRYELRRVHEAVAGGELQRDNFRRQMDPHIEPTGQSRIGTVGRPAQLYRRRRERSLP